MAHRSTAVRSAEPTGAVVDVPTATGSVNAAASGPGREDATVPSGSTGAVRLGIEGLSKAFHRSSGDRVNAVDAIDLEVHAGEIVVLLGPSGCGKSTLLRCIAGLDVPDSGQISIDGTAVFHSAKKIVVPPDRRDVNMMFQSYALWPHMTLQDNVAYPLRIAGGMSRAKAREEARDYLALVGSMVSATSTPRVSAADSSSASRSPGRSSRTRPSCCSTSRCPTSMRRCERYSDGSSCESTRSFGSRRCT